MITDLMFVINLGNRKNNLFTLLPIEICLLVASNLRYSDLEVMSTYSQVFDQILKENYKNYKQFYDLLTWSRSCWNKTLDCIFDNLMNDLKNI